MTTKPDNQMAGVIAIADQIKSEAQAAIIQLRQASVKKTIMLMGDNRDTAQLTGDELGFDAVHAELLPQDKVRWVNEVRTRAIAWPWWATASTMLLR